MAAQNREPQVDLTAFGFVQQTRERGLRLLPRRLAILQKSGLSEIFDLPYSQP